MVQELLQKYLWLIDTFVRAGEYGLSLEELSEKWERRFDASYPRRSFNNHRTAIEDLFHIRIECDRSRNRYFIRYVDDVRDENAASAWLVNTFTVSNLLSLANERLSGRVAVEDIPSGRKWLSTVIEAMMENKMIRIHYKKYNSDSGNDYSVRPYAVKEYAKRWYLVGYCLEREEIRLYGLDRISAIERTELTFKMPKHFDVDELFAECFGIFLHDKGVKPVTVTFRCTADSAKYLIDLPIHPSQKVLSEDANWVNFSIFVRPNWQLVAAFMRFGSSLELLSPASLREQLVSEIKSTLKNYEG